MISGLGPRNKRNRAEKAQEGRGDWILRAKCWLPLVTYQGESPHLGRIQQAVMCFSSFITIMTWRTILQCITYRLVDLLPGLRSGGGQGEAPGDDVHSLTVSPPRWQGDDLLSISCVPCSVRWG